MKLFYLFLTIYLLVNISCEDLLDALTDEPDTTAPTVSISSHTNGESVNGVVLITVDTEDDVGVIKVEFYINDSLVATDNVAPYNYEWNTENYENNTEHNIKVISYDSSENFTESETIILSVFNENSNAVYLWGQSYSIEDTDSLDLSFNDLSELGPIPPEIGNLINLVYLNLSNASLTSIIPPEIGNLINLKDLRLGKNNLTGSIPPEIGNLTNLEKLRLSSSNLQALSLMKYVI